MPTISDLRSRQRSGVRSATSLRFLCAEDITVKCHCGNETGWWSKIGIDPDRRCPHAVAKDTSIANDGRV